VLKLISRLNVAVYRLSAGRLMNRLEGAPICLVTMTGRRSGRTLTLPLMYTPHEGRVLLVASQGGAPEHPGWYFNLKAHPEIELQIGKLRTPMRAREASPEERQALWPVVVANYASFEAYQRTHREIPIFVCAPRG
jgi:F420H(2)-dependent quinone reductase